MEMDWKELDAAFAWGFCSQYPNQDIMLDLLSSEDPPVEFSSSSLEMIRLLVVQCGTFVDMCSVITQQLNELALLNRHLLQKEGQSEPPRVLSLSDQTSHDELPIDAHGEAPAHSGPARRLSRAIENGFSRTSLKHIRPVFRLGRLVGSFLALHWVDSETGKYETPDKAWCDAIAHQVESLPEDWKVAFEVLLTISEACRRTGVPGALNEHLDSEENEHEVNDFKTPFALLGVLCEELRKVELGDADHAKLEIQESTPRVQLFRFEDMPQATIDGKPVEKRMQRAQYKVVAFLVRNHPKSFTLNELRRQTQVDAYSAISRLPKQGAWGDVLTTPSKSKDGTYKIE